MAAPSRLAANGMQTGPPREPSFWIFPSAQMTPVTFSPSTTVPKTVLPSPETPFAPVLASPIVPRETIFPSCQRKARTLPSAFWL